MLKSREVRDEMHDGKTLRSKLAICFVNSFFPRIIHQETDLKETEAI